MGIIDSLEPWLMVFFVLDIFIFIFMVLVIAHNRMSMEKQVSLHQYRKIHLERHLVIIYAIVLEEELNVKDLYAHNFTKQMELAFVNKLKELEKQSAKQNERS